MALRDQIWPCEIKYDLGRRPIALQVGPWLCKTVDDLTRSNMAFRDCLWPCKKTHGLTRRPMAHAVLLLEVPGISLLLSKVTGIPPRPSRFRQGPYTWQRLFAGKRSYTRGSYAEVVEDGSNLKVSKF